MEVRSETEVMASREPFTVAMQKPPSMQNMRLTFTPYGTAVYKPITSTIYPPPQPPNYQGGGGDGGNDAGGVIRAGNVAIPAIPPPHGFNINMSEPIRKKKGRPRKYGSDGTMALALTPVLSPSVDSPSSSAGAFSPSSAPVIPAPVSGSGDAMKKRGRPPGSGTGRKLQMAALGLTGSGFTPHVIAVMTGEDVSAKIMSFSQNGHRAVCILSANGAISNVTLRQAAISGGTVTYEGRFEILSLSGSFLLTENGGQRSRTGGLSVSLADPDGRVIGGGVAGLLTAASPVQVVVGSFIAEGKKEPKHNFRIDPSSAPGKVTSREPMPMTGGNSPPSRGTLSESSGGPGSPMNQSTGRTSNNDGIHPGMVNMPWK